MEDSLISSETPNLQVAKAIIKTILTYIPERSAGFQPFNFSTFQPFYRKMSEKPSAFASRSAVKYVVPSNASAAVTGPRLPPKVSFTLIAP